MKKVFLWILILCLIFSGGCSLLSSKKNTADKSDKEEVKQVLFFLRRPCVGAWVIDLEGNRYLDAMSGL